MSVDLNFWRYQDGVSLDHAAVYQSACCNQEAVEGLAALPTEDILKEIAAAFHGWDSPDPFHYEKSGCGSFQISATPQVIRFDCYSMQQADMKRFSSVMSRFGCPLYDPQQGVRFDKIEVFLIGEAGAYQAQAEETLSRLLPRLEILTRIVNWEEFARLSQTLPRTRIRYDAIIHRAKTLTKVTSTMQFGGAWASRPCQCKTAQLAGEDKAHELLAGLLQKSMERVVGDFLDRTYYQ